MTSTAGPVARSDARRALARPPIVLIVYQVRFDPQPLEARAVLRFQELVGKREYPQIGQATVPQLSIRIGDQPVPQAPGPPNWQIASDTGDWTISIGPDSASLQTANGFTTWEESFQPRLASFLAALSECLSPSISQRFGLRFVNQLSNLEVAQPSDLGNYVSRSLVPAIDHSLGAHLIGAQQQLVLRLADETMCGLRMVFGPEGRADRYGCLLDIDVYSDVARAFSPSVLATAADSLNEQAHQVFESALAPDYLETLK
jgi:uncharacterized protein (TIGR04255 family)